jgi:hypothetical protein
MTLSPAHVRNLASWRRFSGDLKNSFRWSSLQYCGHSAVAHGSQLESSTTRGRGQDTGEPWSNVLIGNLGPHNHSEYSFYIGLAEEECN